MKFPSFLRDLSLSPLAYHSQLLAWCRQMREEAPIAWDEDGEYWLVFRYEDVARVQNDYRTFSSERSTSGRAAGPSIIGMDPPRHQQLRALVSQAFSARTIAGMAPQVEAIVDELLDKIVTRGSCDWMEELANPLPVMVIAKMLGLPTENWPEYKAWSDVMTNQSPEQDQARSFFRQHFAEAIEQRRQQPGSDILSMLMAAEVEEERLSYRDLMMFCFLLLIAGNVTTTNTLGNAMLCFEQYPAEMERLRQQPELLPSAIEEIIRYMPPFRAGPGSLVEGREVKEDVYLCSQLVRKGEKVKVSRFSANFDEQQFPDPERFDIGRNPNRHQSFGHGIHFCLGAPLARLEVRIALEGALKRFREMHIAPGVPLRQTQSTSMFGVQRLPMIFLQA